ncbi:hypothetical protein L6R49_24215 [Myxococcota bacterium]|nr:hypothetical protein [Myxococcota bacterium]
MSLTAFLLTLPNLARAESAVDDCSESAVPVLSERAVYVDGEGCVVDDIGALCKEKYNSDCESWVQVVTRVEAEQPDDADALLKDCTNPRDYYHRYDASTEGLTTYYYYDDRGSIIGASFVSSGAPFCCDGVETDTLFYGEPADPCVVPDEPDDKSDGKTGPCGGGAGGGAAVALLSAITLGVTRRRRQS